MEMMVAGEKERKAKQPIRAREKLLRTKRYHTLHKKAEELEKLCDAKVCVVSYDSDGKFDVWPKDEAKARAIIMEYKKSSSRPKKTKHVKNSGFLGRKKTKLGQENKGFDEKFSLVDNLSDLSLIGLSGILERKIQELNERIDNANCANNVGPRIEAFEEDNNNQINCTNYGSNGANHLDYDRVYEYLLGDYNEISDYNNAPPMMSYNFNEKDCESADNLAENLMGFESSAENSNDHIIANHALRPVGCCSWSHQNQLQLPHDTNVSSMYLEQNHQGRLVDHDVHRHHQQQLSPLQETMMLPSSWWLQPMQTQMTNNGSYSLTPTALHNRRLS